MPIIYEDRVQGSPRNIFEVPSSTGEVLTETFAQAYEENPLKAVSRYLDLREDERTGTRLDAATARARLKDAGLESDLTIGDAGITESALSTLMERKRVEKRRQETYALSEGGIGQGAARLGVSALTSLADPVSAALNFVPVVGEARYARMLKGAGSLLGRTAVRAGVGAAEGAAGAALVEPFIYSMRTQEQADYDAVDSLLNVTLGGFIGGGLHTAVGSLGDLYTNLRPTPVAESIAAQIPRDNSLTGDFKTYETRLANKIADDVDAAVAEYANLKDADGKPLTDGGRILNTDSARELSPDYKADRTRSAAVHEPSSWLVKEMYRRRLAEAPGPGQDNLVLFTGGGTGAGKSTGLELMGDAGKRAQIIYDTNLNGLKSSVDKIEAALDAGKRVQILFTWRDPVDALVNGALPRAERMGRTVPIEEHAKTHVGAAKTIKELAAKYAGDDRVSFTIVDNSRGKGKARLADLSAVRDLEYNRVREDLKQALEGARASGRISEAVYRGTAGQAAVPAGDRPGVRQQPEPQGAGPRPLAAESAGPAPARPAASPTFGTVVYTATGRAVSVRPKVVEAAAVTTSDQAGYPKGLQPRQRDARAASAAQVEQIAKELQPELLGLTPTADTGAPIVGPDGAVESGNGRVMALRRVYEQGGEAAAEYRAWLTQQGYNIEGMREPVLVRERTTPMTDAERQAFAIEANKPGVMSMSPVERAQADAQLMDEAMLMRFRGDDIAAASNQDFVRAFVQKLAPAERNALMDADGHLGQEGVRRIQAALLAKAYGGTPQSVAVLSRMLEATDSDARSVLGALLDAAPSFARLREAVAGGHLGPEYDLSGEIAASVEELARIRATGQSVAEALKQQDLLNPRDPTVDALIRAYHNDALSRLAPRDRIAGTLRQYADDAAKINRAQDSMFGDAPATPAELLNAARAAHPDPKGSTQVDLFGGMAARVDSLPRVAQAEILNKAVTQAVVGERINVAGDVARALRQTETVNFREWFRGSKVVDEAGQPLRVYHGTRNRDIQEFRVSENGEMGAGIYFASSADRAGLYAEGGPDNTGQLIPVYVALQNPAPEAAVAQIRKQPGFQRLETDAERGAEVMRQLTEQGFDGVIRYRMDGGISEVVAFRPNQVKSAVGNSGRFDPNSSSLTDPATVAEIDHAAAERLADEVEKVADPVEPDAVTAELEARASQMEAEARDLAKRLGVEFDDPDVSDVAEAAAKAERWARAAELATVCLVRGG